MNILLYEESLKISRSYLEGMEYFWSSDQILGKGGGVTEIFSAFSRIITFYFITEIIKFDDF